jgi:hypothetical protein
MGFACCAAEAQASLSGADLKKALRRDIDDIARKVALQVRNLAAA